MSNHLDKDENSSSRHHDTDIDDQEALFAELENEEPNTAYTHQRIEQMNSELASRKDIHNSAAAAAATQSSGAAAGHREGITSTSTSIIPTLTTDQSLLDFTTKHPRCIVHFTHPDFSRCATMDRHLERLAGVHNGAVDSEVRFVRVDARDAPFVVEKLRVKVLPCVIGFVEGRVVERVVGFEGLGVGEFDAEREFRTSRLEERFVRVGVLLERRVRVEDEEEAGEGEEEEEMGSDEERNLGRRKGGIRGSRRVGREEEDDEDDEDDDWE